jgi:hypothetical protein
LSPDASFFKRIHAIEAIYIHKGVFATIAMLFLNLSIRFKLKTASMGFEITNGNKTMMPAKQTPTAPYLSPK